MIGEKMKVNCIFVSIFSVLFSFYSFVYLVICISLNGLMIIINLLEGASVGVELYQLN